jgi:hypothetical protein
MNNFGKIYTAEELKKNGTVTLVSLPMEESIMVPVAQAVDLMKQGQNILYFTFDHDSIKINKFFKMALSNYSEEEAKEITGNLAIVDSSQIPEGMSWEKFLEETIKEVKNECELNFVFFDVMDFIKSEQDSLVPTLDKISFMNRFTKIIINTSGAPVWTAHQDPKKAQEEAEILANTTVEEMILESKKLVESSDLVFGIQREKKSFWKKVLNFLLFWRKSNNFTFKVLKNRNGKTKSYRMNLDMETSETKIL